MTTRLAKQPALCAGFLAVLLSPVLADGADLPAGGQVTAGSATIASSGGQMHVNQASPRAVIDWNSFDIGQQSSVTFDMPGTSAAILNRVISGTPTTIAGSITANGQVFLVNPNGIAITGTGAVKVAGGFTASTLDLHNDDFMEGRLNFSGDSPASITHAGQIETGEGGFAALLAHGGIDNQGLISVPMGRVALGTGSAITLDPTGTGFMQILAPAIGEDSGTIRSSGKINAEAGRVEIKAASAAKAVRDIVNVSGEVSVASVRKQGGTIILDSGSSRLRLSGKLDASSRQAKGGRVAVGGKRLALEGARIDATGTSGGMVTVGGGRQGATVPGITTASAVSIDEASTIDASALAESGGEVIVWSDDDTRFFGSIFAVGIGGDGGAAEVSSLGTYAFSGRVNLLSAEGRAGDLLLDPYDVVISSAADANHTGFTATGSGAVINAASLEAALAGASVTVLTGSSGSEAGTITVESPISWNANTTLTLDAAGNIILNAPIAASGTGSGLILSAAGAGGISGGGNIDSSGTLTFNVNNAAAAGTFAGVISGTGQVVKGGPGLLTLAGTNSYTGATTINSGTLRAGSSTALGVTSSSTISGTFDMAGYAADIGGVAGMGLITNSGGAATLSLGRSAVSRAFGGTIEDGAGSISIVKIGGAAQTLDGPNRFTGSITVNLATLQIRNGAGLNNGNYAGDITIGPAGTFRYSSSANQTLSGALSGAGTFTKDASASVITLSNASGFTGPLNIIAGMLRAGSANGFGSAIVSVGSGTTLDLAGFSTALGSLSGAGTITNSGSAATLSTGGLNTSTTFSGILQNGAGTLSLTKTGTGALTLSGSNTYTGQTTISGGTLALSGAGIIVSDIAIGVGTTLSFGSGTSFTYGGVISGSGSMNFSRGMTFTGNNTFTGNSTICTGCTIAVGTGGTSGTLGGTISFNSGANFIFNRADTSIFSGSAGGRVNIIKNGGGTLIVTGSLVSLNGTTINAGTLQIGDGGTTGSVSTTTITNNGALVFSRSDALTLADAISGTGSLTKLGSGTLTLTGSNTYTGATTVTSGTLKAGSSTAFGSNSALTVSGGASLDLGGFSTSIGSLSGGGTVTNSSSAATLTEGSSNANTIFSGILQNGTGTVALVKTGTGTLILTGTNTYSGGTTVHAGAALQMGNGGSTGIVTGNIANSGSVILNTSANGWFNGFSISGTGSFTKAGTGNVLTSVNHTYTGETIVRNGDLWFVGVLPKGNLNVEAGAFNFQPGAGVFTYNGVIIGAGTVRSYTNGTLTLTADSPFSGIIRAVNGNIQLGNGGTSGNIAGSVNIVSGGSLTFNRSDDFIYSGSLGGGSLIKGGSGKLVATGLLSTTGTSINEGTLQIGNGGTTGSISGNIANSATLVFNRSDAFTHSGAISGTGTLTQSGTGTLTLSGANTYTGATTVTSGTLKAGSSTSFGSNSALTASGGASLDLGGFSISIGSLSGGGTITNSGAAATLTEGSLNASTTFSGVLQNGTGTLSLVKMGTGRLILTGASTFTGGTVVNAGSTLQFGAGGAALGSIAGSITNNGTVIVDTTTHGNFYTVMTGSGSFIKRGTATMYAMNNHQYTGDMTVESGMLWFVNGLPQGNMIIGSTGQVDAQLSTSMSYNGLISGSGTLGKRGAGTLTLTANSPFTGAILVRGGNVQIGNGGTSGNIAGPILFQGGNSLTFDRSDGFTFAGAVTGGSLVKNGAGTMVATGALAPTSTTISGGTLQIGDGGTSGSLSGSIMNNAALVFNRSNAVTHSGAVSGTGSLTQAGTGTLTLSGVNSYTGATTVMSGKLKAGSATAFGSNSALTVSSGGSLDLGGFSASIGSLAGAGTVTNSGAAATLTAGDNNTSTTFSGSLQNGAGVMSLVKTGTGTLTLTGDNTHTGLTVIDTGLLALAGSWNAGSTASLEIASGASLVASGTLTAGMLSIGGEGSAALNGANMIGALESSSAIGSLSLNNAQSLILASVQARGTLNLTLSGTSSDLTIGAGAIISSEAAGDAIALSAHHFINNSGAGAISTPNGRWLVYLPSPAGSSFNGLNSGNTAIWNTASGAAVMQQGTRYVFAANPTLNVTSRNVTKTYGDDVSAQIPSAYTITGFAPGMAGAYLPDSEATALSGAPAVISAGGGAAAAAGTYQIEVAQGSLASLTGYGLTFSSTGQLTVDRAALTVAARDASKTYDGLAFSGGNGVTYQGFVAGETEAVLSGSLVYGGAAQGAVNAGTYGLTASGLASGNYDISYAGGQLTVDRAALTVRARDAAKTYDGLAFSGGNGVTYQGFVAAETEAVLSGSLVYGGAAQGAVNAGTYGLTVSGLTSVNYDISYARGLLTVDRAALTVVARDASKTYDGLAFSGGNGVTYQGFVAAETEAVLSGSLVYGGAAQGAVNAGAYGLTVSGLASENYDIAYLGGVLVIEAAVAPAPQPGTESVRIVKSDPGWMGLVTQNTCCLASPRMRYGQEWLPETDIIAPWLIEPLEEIAERY